MIRTLWEAKKCLQIMKEEGTSTCVKENCSPFSC
jgi:hypothetical protein